MQGAGNFFQLVDLEDRRPDSLIDDEVFQERLRRQWEQLGGQAPQPLEPSPDFKGSLFDYQKHGLGWFFLMSLDLMTYSLMTWALEKPYRF